MNTKTLSTSPHAASAIPDLVDGFGTTVIAPETAHAARLAVCGRARDAEDAAMLLAMLGLAPDTARTVVQNAARRVVRGEAS